MIKKLSILAIVAVFVFVYSEAKAQTAFNEDEYIKCMQGNTEQSDDYAATCMSAEVKKYDEAINKLYETFLKNEQFQRWNNGNGLFRGNIKDTNDSFAAFRSRFCSFYNLAMQNYSVSKEYGRQECMMKLSEFYHQYLLQIYRDHDADML